MKRIKNLKNILNDELRNIQAYNKRENQHLTSEFKKKVVTIKEKNSQIVFENYYLPKAMVEISQKEGFFGINQKTITLASSMMFKDLSDGTLDEFYKFTK